MATTLIDAAQVASNNGEFKRAGVILSFARGSQLLAAMPTSDIQGNSYTYSREQVLPTTAFRALNLGYTESSGKLDTRTEVLKPCGGDLDVDRYLVVTGGMDVRSAQEDMQARSLGQLLGLKILKGDSGSDPLEFDGLQKRYGGSAPTLGTAGTLDEATRILSNHASGGALVTTHLDYALDSVDNGIGRKVIVGPQKLRRRLTAYLRGSGTAVTMERDAFGNQIMQYGGADWIDADQNGDTAGITFDENSASNASIYVIALGESGVQLLQSPGGMQVFDLGQIPDKPVFRTRTEWIATMTDHHTRCVVRLAGITDAAITA